MVKLLLLLLSVFVFEGCTVKEITVVAPSEIYVPKYNDYNVTVKVRKNGENLIISTSDFNKRTKQIKSLKYHIKAVESIIYQYNKTNKELANEKLR